MPTSTIDAAEIRRRYLSEAVLTASPPVRLTMLLDRLDLDLRSADAGFEHGSAKAVSDSLVHAQEIVLALRDTLRLDLWDGAPRLRALYDYLKDELIAANVTKDRARAAGAAGLLGQIAEAWREAAVRNQAQPEMASGLG